MKQHKRAGVVLMVLAMASVFSTWAMAGELEPSADPAPTMHNLEDIYNLIANMDPPAPVAKTGQQKSYETGDDGDKKRGIAWPDHRFTDNNNGTVTDNLTGLIWLKNVNRFGTRTWEQALADCNSLAADGEDLTDGSKAGDWRLPNINELLSLHDFSRHNPALPTDHLFSNVGQGYYCWSSTTLADDYNNDSAYHMDAYIAGLGAWLKSEKIFVWPVRGGN
jgi:hypothetical protein